MNSTLGKKKTANDEKELSLFNSGTPFKEENSDSEDEKIIIIKGKRTLPQEDDADDTIKVDDSVTLGNEKEDKNIKERFLDLPLSRQSLINLNALGFSTPTPIQKLAIPVIMQGKNVCGTATTGSGKTAAFLLPLIERFSHTDADDRPQALILLPTRELAAQCFKVAEKLVTGLNVTAGLISGGMPIGEQKKKLAQERLDLIIGTPGRVLDLSTSDDLKLERMAVLVLDEADRMLDEGFEKELREIKLRCTFPEQQTLLFSATLTLKDATAWIEPSSHSPNPEVLKVSESSALAQNLTQQFVRIRQVDDVSRQATLLALLNRIPILSTRVIIFVARKEHAGNIAGILRHYGFAVAELHGDLNQQERNKSLNSFTLGEVDYLVATDVAARGIDIKDIKAVVNYEMPPTYAQYQHRVGRTARAGSSGFSISLIGEKDRKVLKECMKNSPLPFSHRLISPQVIQRYRQYISYVQSSQSTK